MEEDEKNAVVEEVVQSPEELIPLSLSLSLCPPNPSSSFDFPTPTNPNSTLFPDPRSPSFARLLNHQSASYDLDSRDLDRSDRSDNGETDNDDDLVQTKKKRRTVWTLELHRKFSEAVNYLGVGNAGPKTIMERMNVDGLTRESVASHLQKYRDYLKLKLNSAENSITDRQFATIPLPLGPAPAAPGYNVASSLPSTSQNVLHSRQIVGRVGARAPCPVFLDIASPNVDEKIEEGGGETKELPLFPTGKD